MTTVNSFKTVRDLEVKGSRVKYCSLPALQQAGFPGVARLPYSLKILLENLLRCEDGAFVKAADIEALATWDPAAKTEKEIAFTPARVLLQDFTGRAGRCRPRRDARRDGAPGRRPEPREPAAADGTGHRPLGAGRSLRHARRVQPEHRSRVLAQQGALHVPALGPERVRQLPRRAARDGHRAPGEPRVPRARRLQRAAGRRGVGVPRHGRRHRLAHDDGERPRRGGLGRGRHRGRGRDARPADLDADSAGARLPARRLAAGRHDGDRPRADRDRAAAQARRGRQVRRVLRGRPREPDARRSRDALEHVPGVRRDGRDLPDRRDDHRLPAPVGPGRGERGAGRGLREGAGAVRRRRRARGALQRGHRTRPRDGRAVAGRAEAAAGSRVAGDGEGEVHRGAAADAGRAQEAGRRARGRRRGGGGRGGHRSRRGRDGGDHQLHEHVEPERAHRGRPGGEEGGREGAVAQAVGEDEPGARVEGGDGVPREGRPGAVSRSAGIQSRGLRLHDVHRQQRAAARGGGRADRGEGADCRLGAERQPQLRRPRAAAGARQLPRVAAAGRGLCDCRAR